MRKYVGLAAMLAVVFAAGWAARPDGPSGVVLRADTIVVPPSDYDATKDALAAAEGEVTGLRARVRGLEGRRPTTVIRADSVLVTDTVFVTIDQRGRLTYQLATSLDRPAPVELYTGIDIADCDDGVTVRDRRVTCNRARAGHAYLTATLSRQPQLGLTWRKSYRSPWEFGIATDGSRVDAYVRRSLQLW